MKHFPSPRSSALVKSGLLTLLLAAHSFASLQAGMPESLLPTFGTDGAEFNVKGKDGHVVRGWLPNDWVDNSEWAPISATYEQLEDRPDDAMGAVRIKVEKLEGDGELQLTSYAGERIYEAGKRYRIIGWMRSPEPQRINIDVRQGPDPYENYHHGEATSGKTWKSFQFSFQPTKNRKALIMLSMAQTGTLDIAGLTVAEGGPGPSLLPTFGTEGRDFSQPGARNHLVKGWLPEEWVDNSEWAPVNATYTRLEMEDAPPETMSAVRIKVETVSAGQEDAGQLQLTAYGEQEYYQQGQPYKFTGWVRSADSTPLQCQARQPDEPYATYHQTDVTTTPEWKPFTFTFRPEMKIKAIMMLVVSQAGTVDLAGLTLSEQ